MRVSWLVPLAFCLALVAVPARAEEAKEPKAVIEKAIEAVGGADRIDKHKASTMKAKGTVQAQGMTIEWSGDFTQQLPKQSKASMQIEAGGQKVDVLIVVNGDKGWMKIQGNTMEMDKDRIAEQGEQHHAEWVVRLVPLVKGKGFTLSPLGEVKVNGKEAVGIKVAHKGHRDIDLYFDTKTGLLLKSETRVKDESGQEMTQESFFSHYKEFDGLKRPAKVLIKRDGKDFLSMDVSEYKFMEKVDDSEFAMP